MKTMKKAIALMLCFLMMTGMLSVVSFASKDVLTYEVTEFGYAQLVSCSKDAEGEITVAESVTIDAEEYLVKGIADEAFKDCTQVTRITLPEGVTVIGARAFSNCKSLAVIDIPSTVVNCSYDAFEGCGKIRANCYKTNYQFFAVYGFADNLEINVVDSGFEEETTKAVNSIVDLIKQLILKILAFFGIVKA